MASLVKPVIEVDEKVAKALHDILEQACWDLGKIKDNSESNVKRVEDVKIITLSEGYHSVAFAVKIKKSNSMETLCYG